MQLSQKKETLEGCSRAASGCIYHSSFPDRLRVIRKTRDSAAIFLTCWGYP